MNFIIGASLPNIVTPCACPVIGRWQEGAARRLYLYIVIIRQNINSVFEISLKFL
ncbi:MAG TPA: hypothetical protein PKA28_08985 [Methylomusa anaerophila]|uniref:hypothetical protein n=1 Tax=Methylomusa anaerophila TaxID=1930071 RepID=UPI0013154D61|nr:hypothetical protein [Methylomusa anaerophila]HML88570.1 hypothetical protein [Methylomusa anaerophila]